MIKLSSKTKALVIYLSKVAPFFITSIWFTSFWENYDTTLVLLSIVGWILCVVGVSIIPADRKAK